MPKRLTTGVFIEKANKIHDGKYDYSLVKYINALTKIEIICHIHGHFWQFPNRHLQGAGCPKCGNLLISQKNSSNKGEFIQKANKIYNNKYDYSKVVYKGVDTKVCINCPKHGYFWQKPVYHLQGYGCQKCSYERVSSKSVFTTEHFIEKAKKIHGSKYAYSKVNYKNNKTKVCIICPEHGEFWQMPCDHLNYHGCPKCARENLAKKQALSTDEFIERAKKMHGNKYDYSKVKYKNESNKVIITCPIHGEFEQVASYHLQGNGCPKCGGSIQKTTEQFIEEARKVHGNRYNYSKVNYVSAHKKVCIICHKHGEFWQTPNSHLKGANCNVCSKQMSTSENELSDFMTNELKLKVEQRDRKVIRPQEIDIYLPNEKIGIEYDGLIWHSDRFSKNKYNLLNKTELCEKHGIRLIHIFEDEWLEHKDIVKSNLKIFFNKSDIIINANKCILKKKFI